ncbi:MAG: class D sortase [Candidatus Solibacter sp.]
MGRAALALMGIGLGTALVGAVLGLAAWQGQSAGRIDWELETQVQIADAGAAGERQELTRLTFPDQGAQFIVWEGATKKNLLYGPARVAGSAVPGGKGNCIIAAHRDTHFRILREVKKDQDILLERNGRSFHYRITGLHIVGASDKRYYGPAVTPTLTLVTCYPFSYLGKAPKRFIVQAQLWTSSGT